MLKKHGLKAPIYYGAIGLLLLIGFTGLTGCGRQQAVPPSDTKARYSEEFMQKFDAPKVGVLLSKQDNIMNQAISTSLANLQATDNLDLKLLQANELTSTEEGVRYLAENGYQLILGLAPDFSAVIKKIGGEYPNVYFLTLNGEVPNKNVVNIQFKEQEAGFLAGALAAQVSKNGLVGFIGDRPNNPLALAQQAGFYQGVNYINNQFNKTVRITGNFLGTKAADATVQKAKAVALAELNAGADILFQAAGPAGDGVFQAASQQGGVVIGSEENQNWKLPGQVPASMMNNLDVVFKNVLSQFSNHKLRGGTRTYSVANGGITYTDFRNIELEEKIGVKYKQTALDRIMQIKAWVPDAVVAEMGNIRTGLTNGSIKVSAQIDQNYVSSLAPLPAPVVPTPAPKAPAQKNPPPSTKPKTPAETQPSPPATNQQPGTSPAAPTQPTPGGQQPSAPPNAQMPGGQMPSQTPKQTP